MTIDLEPQGAEDVLPCGLICQADHFCQDDHCHNKDSVFCVASLLCRSLIHAYPVDAPKGMTTAIFCVLQPSQEQALLGFGGIAISVKKPFDHHGTH